nr:unnamed protein product [Callosobruchus chinensis]
MKSNFVLVDSTNLPKVDYETIDQYDCSNISFVQVNVRKCKNRRVKLRLKTYRISDVLTFKTIYRTCEKYVVLLEKINTC